MVSQCLFDMLSEAHGPSAGPPEANGLHDWPPDRPPKVHGPRGHCTPCPPLEGPVCAAEIRLSFDCMHFAFFLFFRIYIEKEIMRVSA